MISNDAKSLRSLNTKKIAVLRAGAIGDVIHTLPMVYALKDLRKVKITYLTSGYLLELLGQVPAIDHLLEVDLKANPLFLPFVLQRQAKTLRAEKFHTFVDLQRHWKAGFLAEKSSASHIYTYQVWKEDEGHAWQNFASTYFPPPEIEKIHLQDYLPLFKIPPSLTKELWMQLKLPPEDNKPRIAIIPGVGHRRIERAWSIKAWIALIKMLSFHCRIVLLGGNDDKDVCHHIESEFAIGPIEIHNLCGKLSLLQTACLLQQADLAVGGDTGPVHLSASLCTKTIMLFGPTSVLRHAPFYGRSLRAKYECDLSCTPKKCAHKNQKNCMDHIRPIDVYRVIEEYLSATQL